MNNHPTVIKLLCVAGVVCIVLPLGRVLFPYVADVVDNMQFNAIEAVVSAVGGFGIYLALFG